MLVKIVTEHGTLVANINDSVKSNFIRTIIKSLPLKGFANRWGDEIYFDIGLKLDNGDAQSELEIGTIAYWPPGSAICIFFGRTPISDTDKPKPYSPVVVLGRIIDREINILQKVKDGEIICITK